MATLRKREDWLTLLDALERGDRVALARVTRLIMGYLARFRAHEFQDSWDDICQNVLTALIRSRRRGALRDPGAFVSYVGTITRNELVNWIRRDRRPRAAGALEGLEAQLERGVSVPEPGRDEDPDLRVDLARALGSLEEKNLQVVTAIYLNGQTYEQAAKTLGMPLGSLKRHQTQGLRELRQLMGMDPR
jgi:RNA polymerase sigma-70 factor (ECF subfamily)